MIDICGDKWNSFQVLQDIFLHHDLDSWFHCQQPVINDYPVDLILWKFHLDPIVYYTAKSCYNKV